MWQWTLMSRIVRICKFLFTYFTVLFSVFCFFIYLRFFVLFNILLKQFESVIWNLKEANRKGTKTAASIIFFVLFFRVLDFWHGSEIASPLAKKRRPVRKLEDDVNYEPAGMVSSLTSLILLFSVSLLWWDVEPWWSVCCCSTAF